MLFQSRIQEKVDEKNRKRQIDQQIVIHDPKTFDPIEMYPELIGNN